MAKANLKLIIDYDNLDITPYDFSKRVLEESRLDLWERDIRGNPAKLKLFEFAAECSRTMDRILKEKKNG